jgi:hypothetical protein
MFKSVDYGRILREQIEHENEERNVWRAKHRAQVFIVERVLLPLRMGLIILTLFVFSPFLIFVWIVRWACTGETWPLRNEP